MTKEIGAPRWWGPFAAILGFIRWCVCEIKHQRCIRRFEQ